MARASGEPNRIKVGVLSQNDLRSIAETKMPDLNALDIDAAMKVVAGTARSMGVLVQGIDSASSIAEFEEAPPPEEVPEDNDAAAAESEPEAVAEEGSGG